MATIGGASASPAESHPSGATASVRKDARQFAKALSGLVPLVQFRERDRLQPYSLTPTQWAALSAIVGAGTLTVNDLAGALYLEKSTASRIAAGLVEREVVLRAPQPGDARTVRMSATESGQAMYAAVAADEERDYAVLLESVAAEWREASVGMLAEISALLAAGVSVGGGRCSLSK